MYNCPIIHNLETVEMFNAVVSPGDLLKFSRDTYKKGYRTYQNKYIMFDTFGNSTAHRDDAPLWHSYEFLKSNLYSVDRAWKFFIDDANNIMTTEILTMFLNFEIINHVNYIVVDNKTKKTIIQFSEKEIMTKAHKAIIADEKNGSLIKSQQLRFYFLIGKEKYFFVNYMWTPIKLLQPETFLETQFFIYSELGANYFSYPFFCEKL